MFDMSEFEHPPGLLGPANADACESGPSETEYFKRAFLRAATPAGDPEGWSQEKIKQGAELLVQLREFLQSRGIRSMYDAEVSSELRELWLYLIDSKVVYELSIEEIGRQWEYVDPREHHITNKKNVKILAKHTGAVRVLRKGESTRRRNRKGPLSPEAERSAIAAIITAQARVFAR